jgi:hypothetical protein
MNERQKILDRVRALLSKTVDNGCTEAEAMAALAKAQEMMAAHNVHDAELQMQRASAGIAGSASANDPHLVRQYLGMSVGTFCNCRVWSSQSTGVTFCGVDGDETFAVWLLDTLAAFVHRELKAFRKTLPKGNARLTRMHTKGFVIGCCRRISDKLNELARANAPASGAGLVVCRNALIDEKLADMHFTSRQRRVSYAQSAYAAGHEAGASASFNRPVNGGKGVALLT